MPEWVYDRSERPPIFLPESVYARRHELIDVTAVGDVLRKYMDPVTFQLHDGSTYLNQKLESEHG